MARKKKTEITDEDLIKELNNIQLEYDMAKKLSKLSKVNENISINRYDNGWMVEVSGNDHGDCWQNKKFIFPDLKSTLTFVEEYSKIKLN